MEERIVKRAQQKQSVQQTVYSGEAFKADVFKPQEVMDLLFDDEDEELRNTSAFVKATDGKKKSRPTVIIEKKRDTEKGEEEPDKDEGPQNEEMEIEYNMSDDQDDEN